MTHSAHELEIQQWLADLAIRCEPRSRENLTVLIADYARGLADLPYEVWTEPCRNAAAEEWERFPSYKALRKFLRGWAERHAERPRLALPAGVHIDTTLQGEDRFAVEQWWRLRPKRMEEGTMARALDLLRTKPAAFRAVCASDLEAEAIARQRGWTTEPERIDVSEGGIARNLVKLEALAGESERGRLLARFGLAILRKNVLQHAPERAHMLPEAIAGPQRNSRETSDRRQDEAAAASARAQAEALGETPPPQAPPARPLGGLKPERLAAIRDADPRVQQAREIQRQQREAESPDEPPPIRRAANDEGGTPQWPDWMDPPPMAAE